MRIHLILFFALLGFRLSAGEARFIIGGKEVPLYTCRIILPANPLPVETKAATELQKYLEKISGVRLEITDDASPKENLEIVIGFSRRFPAPVKNTLDPDGFIIDISSQSIVIAGGSHKGTLYGVYEFLERFPGVRFWAPGAELIPALEVIGLPVTTLNDAPAFRSREVYYAGLDDPDFNDKMRCDRHAWKDAEEWGLWVHTMFTLVPPDRYFEPHPEYYALMAGKRARTQLCLSNPDVLKVTVEELRKRMEEKPGAKYWSVSQMDTYGSCECDACRAINEREGSPSGSLVAFINQVASSFPDKVISTLAYQYTRKPPAHIRPAANVNIMLCTIECDRSKPLDTDTSTGSFVSDLKGWSAISNDILVWDYVIQFTNMIGPFPNLPVLQPNIRLFKKYGVSAVFEQGCRGTYSESQELREYLLAKLLWNPERNADSLENEFLQGYYGKAAPYIRNYLRTMEEHLRNSGKTLWIYSSPMQETGSFLGPEMVPGYEADFDSALDAVNGDSALTARVNKVRLSLQYAILEIAKKNITGPEGFIDQKGKDMVVRQDRLDQLADFAAKANLYGVKTVHERGYPPDMYREETERFFHNAYTVHLAKGRPYTLAKQPSPKYSAEGAGSLTDGKRGSANYYVLWQGFEEDDLEAVADLGKPVEMRYVGAEFLQDLASWIFYPEMLEVSVSDDGQTFRAVARFDSLSFSDPVLIRETGKEIPATTARYVRFFAKNVKKCPAWHIGHGGKAWLFVDEMVVR